MRKSLLMTAVLVLAACWAMAQSSASQQPDTSQSAKPDTSQSAQSDQTVEGCLTRQANKLILIDARGYSYELFGDTSAVHENIGHQVRLYGYVGNSGGGPDLQAQGPQRVFGVKKVESLSDSCK